MALAWMPDRGWTTQSAMFVVRLWLVPIAAVYVFGLGLAWVMRGFGTSRSVNP